MFIDNLVIIRASLKHCSFIKKLHNEYKLLINKLLLNLTASGYLINKKVH
jgi:hypothetical protein